MTASDRAAAATAKYEAAVEGLRASGALDPQVWERGCSRCGGDLDVHPYAVRSGDVPTVRTVSACAVCRIDRVRRWTDLVRASAWRGKDLRTTPPGFTARLCETAGLVAYDQVDGAWELTATGTELLATWDARGADGARA